MEEYCNNDNLNVHQSSEECPVQSNVAGGEELSKENETVKDLHSNNSPPPGDSNINLPSEDIQNVGNNSADLELKSSEPNVTEDDISKSQNATIESELEKIHGVISENVTEKATEANESVIDDCDKMDWTADLSESVNENTEDNTNAIDKVDTPEIVQDTSARHELQEESDKTNEKTSFLIANLMSDNIPAPIESSSSGATDEMQQQDAELTKEINETPPENVVEGGDKSENPPEEETKTQDISGEKMDESSSQENKNVDDESSSQANKNVNDESPTQENKNVNDESPSQENKNVNDDSPSQENKNVNDESSSQANKNVNDESPSQENKNVNDESPSQENKNVNDESPSQENKNVNNESSSQENKNVNDDSPSQENKNVNDESSSQENKNVNNESSSQENINVNNESSSQENKNVNNESSSQENKNVNEELSVTAEQKEQIESEGATCIDTKNDEENKSEVATCIDTKNDEENNAEQTQNEKTSDTAIDNMECDTEKAEEKTDNKDSAKDNLQDETTTSSVPDTPSTDNHDKDKSNFNQRENTEFVQVNSENEKDAEENEKDDTNNRTLMEHDPIASDSFEPINNEDQEGADEELCIIPDTQREISQAEKDAASTMAPLRDLTEASASVQSEKDSETVTTDHSLSAPIIVFKYDKEDLHICNECRLKRKVKYYYAEKDVTRYLCDDNCLSVFKDSQEDKVVYNWEEGSLRVKNFSGTTKEPPSLSFIRKCAACKKVTNDIENNLTWEIMDFCNEICLSEYQKKIGSHCSSCQGEVKSNSLGKYCVRFGNDIRQFCTSMCLEKYKKGLKVCSYCQQDMSGGPAGFLAPVGDKGQFKDFCSQLCMEKYDIMTNDRPPKVAEGTICSVCKAEKPITIEFELSGCRNYFCSEPCFVAFSFVNNISPGKCAMCRRHFPKSILEKHTMYYDNVQHSFCSNSCENIYIIAHRKIVPCSWCKVKKYNFDMIRRYSKSGPMINMCSVNCLSLYRVSINAVSSRKTVCNFCQKLAHPMYHLTMSDATIRNFCTYNCVMGFQNQFPKQPITLNNLGESGFPVPTGAPKKNKKHPGPDLASIDVPPPLPIISSVQSLASSNGSLAQPVGIPPGLTPINTRSTRSKTSNSTQMMNSTPQIINSLADLPVQVQIKQHFIVRPAPMPEQRNVSTMCYTRKAHKGTTIKPIMVDEEMQTDEREASKILIPVPVPIYVPTPMRMFSVPVPVPVPFPVPVPVPIFIPTTRNSAAGIMKEIKKIQVKIPTDPYEAELLMMAEMVAEEKKEEPTDSESDVDDAGAPEDSYSPEPVDASNTFGDDMLQMALKMATELDEPAVDLEGALTANTITAPQGGEAHPQDENVDDPQPMHHMMERSASVRGRKRGMRQSRGGAKRGRRASQSQGVMPIMHQIHQPAAPSEPTEKPDANMCLKYTFGVNAWKQWVTTKNAELEKSSRCVMLFKTEILQLSADELNYSLCLFVKEVRKPNGAEYAPDTIYYLCLGIQQYLFENGRIDNIFCDPYYEKFTDCLDEVAKKFSVLYNDSHYIVTRVEEEHLWESKQLGAHSPHVLLSTLMFFNTKHFNLTSVDEHMQLSFSHIMKHWKRNPNQPSAKVPGSRNVLLRFYPPQSAIQNNARKKKVYEQEQNEENPLRCPVKLYEFYISKCPESVKTRNDVFYLQPERSCVPDSPVWYSTMPLPREALEKMLHRVKMVKEINVALLTS